MNPHLTLLLVYSVAQVGLGLWIGRVVRTTGDFFVAGRRLPAFLLFSTMLAANIGAAVITVYFVAGGLLSSAWVNLVQLVVKLVGFAVAVPLAIAAAGGVEGLRSAPGLPADFFDFLHGGRSGLPLLALLGPAFIVSPGLVQKAYGAVDERAIRIG